MRNIIITSRATFRNAAFKTVCLFLICLLSACSSDGGGGDSDSTARAAHHVVLVWNQAAIDASGIDHEPTAAGEQLGPTRASRAMAIVHIAMFEAFNAVTPRYRSYINLDASEYALNDELIPEVALSRAARDTLAFLYPSQTPGFDQLYQDELVLYDDSTAASIEQSEALGARVAREIIALRSNDGSELGTNAVENAYEFSPLPGRWRKDPFTPEQTPLGSKWSSVQPFLLLSSDQFRSPPPPALDSAEYAEAYAEVYRLGGDGVQTPTERTEEQTEIGIFWAYDGTPSLCAPPRMYNQIVRTIIKEYGPNDALDTARLLALVNVSMADAAISIWEAKFFYDLWRPVTAIRESDVGTGPSGLGDGNPLTPGDPTFKPLGAPASNLFSDNFTPPFPTYPSGHGGFGGALFEVLRQYYGTDELPFSFVSDEFNGLTLGSDGEPRPVVERSFARLSDAEEENAQSRIYLGIHFSFDKTSAVEQGRNVARYVTERLYPPLGE
jgi:hypothetical protein